MKRSLTDAACRNAKPSTPTTDATGKEVVKPYKLTDGGGLYLMVSSTGKYWRYKYRFNGKERALAIGTYPEIGLKDARERHEEARALLARDVDPSAHKQALKAVKLAEVTNSFEAVAREWFVKFSHKWVESHSKKIMRRLERDIFPWIGSRPIAELEPPDVLHCLRRIEERGALETAHRAKQDCGQIFRYAVATHRAQRDQTADLKGAIPPPKKTHHAAIIEPSEVGELLRAMNDYHGSFKVRIALKLSAYLFQRPGEIRHMEWTEINFETALWEIPADKMKMRNAHIVPLARQAVALLEEIKPLTGHRRYVFPSNTDIHKPMSDNTLRQALRRLGYDNNTMTPHGFRALARTIMDEELEIKEKYIEQQLAHAVKDANGTAYNRTKHLKQRTPMMQQWADYLDSLRDGAQVIPIRRAG